MSALPSPQAVFFDWDGTLVDSFDLLEAAHNYALAKLEKPAFKERNWFRTYFGRPREEIYAEIYGANGPRARQFFEEYVTAHHQELVQPMPGAQDALEAVRLQGVPCGVVSNKRTDFILSEIKHFDWHSYFSVVIGAADAAQDKPEADPLLEAMKQAGLDHKNPAVKTAVWYVGDTEMDLLCAQNAGCPAVFITHNNENKDLLRQYKPAKTLKNCGELVELLLQCGKN